MTGRKVLGVLLVGMTVSAAALTWPQVLHAQAFRVYVRPVTPTTGNGVVELDAARRATARAQLVHALKLEKVVTTESAADADVVVEILSNLEPPPEKQTEIGWKPFIGFYPKAQIDAPIDVAILVGEHREEIRGREAVNTPRQTAQRIHAWMKNNAGLLKKRRAQQ